MVYFRLMFKLGCLVEANTLRQFYPLSLSLPLLFASGIACEESCWPKWHSKEKECALVWMHDNKRWIGRWDAMHSLHDISNRSSFSKWGFSAISVHHHRRKRLLMLHFTVCHPHHLLNSILFEVGKKPLKHTSNESYQLSAMHMLPKLG